MEFTLIIGEQVYTLLECADEHDATELADELYPNGYANLHNGIPANDFNRVAWRDEQGDWEYSEDFRYD